MIQIRYEILKEFGILLVIIKFGGADKISISFLESCSIGFFIDVLLDNQNPEIPEFLKRNYFENGAVLFGRESPEEMQDFRDVCKAALDGLSKK